ncbi:MAG: glycoside hydrolase family 3 protein [Firmicutes bacterium]|nr:glycoside hydrolase family 3 protein [Bacillota bacterium]
MISPELKIMIGQMLMAGFPSSSLDPSAVDSSHVHEQAKNLLNDFFVGNYIYFSRNIESAAQCCRLSAALSRMVFEKTGIAPFITTDQEGGIVSRLVEGAALIPGAAAIGAACEGIRNRKSHAAEVYKARWSNLPSRRVFEIARMNGEILKACGINLNLAPDMDVNVEPENPIIGCRSFGDDPQKVAENAIAFMKGLQEAGVAVSLKHFPGHGNVKSDSHLGIPINDTPESVLRETEFKPFEEAVKAGADTLLTAHVRYTQVDPDQPATLSRKIMTDLLRGEFGFEGLVLTDCLEMGAIKACYGIGEGAVRAIEAGADILTISHTYQAAKEAAEAIYQAVETGRILPERIMESYQRIKRIKEKYGLLSLPQLSSETAEKMVQDPARKMAAHSLMKDSMTLLRGAFDLDFMSGDYLVVFCDQSPSNLAEDMRPLSMGSMIHKKTGAPAVCFAMSSEEVNVEEVLNQVKTQLAALRKKNAGASSDTVPDPVPVLLGLYNVRFREGQQAILKEMSLMAQRGEIRLYVLLMGAPYDLPLIQNDACVITTYEYTRLSAAALIEALEEKSFPGISPFKV